MSSAQHPHYADTEAGVSIDEIPSSMHLAIRFVVQMGGLDLLHKIVTLFAATGTERINELRFAVDANDRQRISRLAHAMMGSANQVGADELRQQSSRLEDQAHCMGHDELLVMVTDLGVTFDRARAMLELARGEEHAT